jgi:single-stranded DNA-binding protein
MRQTNHVVLVGYVAKDPEISKSEKYAWFLIVNERDDKTNFFMCRLFHPIVQLAKYIKKGEKILVEGHVEQYEKSYTITVERIEFLSHKKEQERQKEEQTEQTVDIF